ncbi:hypothetical protein LMG28138_05249 [Pararobbsia alpina]|uniref:mRNA interferase toxin RelE n=2 Tax=Pararobbsia alpina TaxID=621374 RepID=A0A6S7BJT2_9BURK|nr:hypothetical protein LMG28138_05249 [Pararobbsia alpina]
MIRQRLTRFVREQFKKKLKERLENPRVPSAALSTMADTYKIKLASLGFRLVYRVDEGIVTVTVPFHHIAGCLGSMVSACNPFQLRFAHG